LAHPAEERFCGGCGAPLVPASEEEAVDERTRRARKVMPRYARGEPGRVAVARNLAEGEMLQGILLEEGIPSYLRRSGGFDVPDFLAAGPRDVMVPSSGVSAARELLGTDDPAVMELEARPSQNAFRILAAILIVLLLASLITGTLWSLTR
jgi:hypothetical protein